VVKPGRTLTVCEARAYAFDGGKENLVATMTGTMMAIMPQKEQTEIRSTQNAAV
jgi:acyl-coenzyme A thioesterase PaaI-like protein